MAKSDPNKLSRPVTMTEIPPVGLDVTVETTAEQRAVLARDIDLPGIPALTGRFHLTSKDRGVSVKGTVEGIVTQRCVVTLETFDAPVREDVDVAFSEEAAEPAGFDDEEGGEGRHELTAHDLDAPDPIVNGRIDLGALTAEFLVLGLDPYPRKPGVAFEAGPEPERESPFAALQRLKDNGET